MSGATNQKYNSIDYSNWDFSGKGGNVLHLLSPIERRMWDESFQYQDKRYDAGHIQTVTHFALKLLNPGPLGGIEANRDIVMPATILHDIGWSQMHQAEIDLFFVPNLKDYEPILRDRHQKLGTELAGKILKDLNYNPDYVRSACEIISQHDTRTGFLSPEDGVMRDADKLWRFTLGDLLLAVEKRATPLDVHREKRLKDIEKNGFFCYEQSKSIARTEFTNAIDYYCMMR